MDLIFSLRIEIFNIGNKFIHTNAIFTLIETHLLLTPVNVISEANDRVRVS